MTFSELKLFYKDHFSLGNLNGDMSSKFVLIALICYVTHKAQLQKPGVTHYQIIMKITQDCTLPEDFVQGLAIICEDFAYNCKEFPTFNIKPKEIISTIKNILKSYLPF